MKNPEEIKCYVCNKIITPNQISAQKSFYIGQKFGKKLYRHKKCEGKVIKDYKKIRKVWKIDPRTRFKEGNKKIRRRDKQKTKNELKERGC